MSLVSLSSPRLHRTVGLFLLASLGTCTSKCGAPRQPQPPHFGDRCAVAAAVEDAPGPGSRPQHEALALFNLRNSIDTLNDDTASTEGIPISTEQFGCASLELLARFLAQVARAVSRSAACRDAVRTVLQEVLRQLERLDSRLDAIDLSKNRLAAPERVGRDKADEAGSESAEEAGVNGDSTCGCGTPTSRGGYVKPVKGL